MTERGTSYLSSLAMWLVCDMVGLEPEGLIK